MYPKQDIKLRLMMFKNGLCIKQKSILFVLLLISILLLTLYFQNKSSNKNYLIQLEHAYIKSFENYKKTFLTKLLKYYEDMTPMIENEQLVQRLYKKNKYLKSIEIKAIEETTQYKKQLLENKALFDAFVNKKNEVFYKLLIPINKKGSIKSYAIYIIDVRMFLSSVKKYDNSNGIIFVRNNDRSDDIYLKEYLESEIFKFMVESCSVHQGPVMKVQDEFYVKKELELKNLDGETVANGVFFLDVTKEKMAYKSTLRDSQLTSILLFIIAAIVINYFFSYLVKRIQKNEKELKTINKNLENMVEKEIEHRLKVQKEALEEKQKSDELLIQQSKLAMLGEMIGNIAHQWRQPLMQLSAILMYLDAYNEKGKLTSDKLLSKVKDGNSIIDFMSKTIEDFRNYYKPEKQKEEFFIKDSIDSALFIVNSALKHSNIKVNTNYSSDDLSLVSYKNEFSQALLNIITNAKDILIQRNIESPCIDIEVKKENGEIKINILDNAGGIEEEIIDKVFDPYFTTKHQSQGTGIGLYMTKMIIENNMNGTIKVKNKELGAVFSITLES